jgi:hypothetical protein
MLWCDFFLHVWSLATLVSVCQAVKRGIHIFRWGGGGTQRAGMIFCLQWRWCLAEDAYCSTSDQNHSVHRLLALLLANIPTGSETFCTELLSPIPTPHWTLSNDGRYPSRLIIWRHFPNTARPHLPNCRSTFRCNLLGTWGSPHAQVSTQKFSSLNSHTKKSWEVTSWGQAVGPWRPHQLLNVLSGGLLFQLWCPLGKRKGPTHLAVCHYAAHVNFWTWPFVTLSWTSAIPLTWNVASTPVQKVQVQLRSHAHEAYRRLTRRRMCRGYNAPELRCMGSNISDLRHFLGLLNTRHWQRDAYVRQRGAQWRISFLSCTAQYLFLMESYQGAFRIPKARQYCSYATVTLP